MSEFSERAPAKINLTLKILGRTTAGFHALESLVAFAEIADIVSLDQRAPSQTIVAGPFGAELGDGNILDVARPAIDKWLSTKLGRLTLEKKLPVAAGIGGGSADAAALLRIVRQHLIRNKKTEQEWLELARELGADVPVCFINQLAFLTSDGRKVTPIGAGRTLDLPVVLVNARSPVPSNKTARVFEKLGCQVEAPSVPPEPPEFSHRAALLDYISIAANDLTEPAKHLMPEVDNVLQSLNCLPNCSFARLSGAGPTCFAAFEKLSEAQAAATYLKQQQPTWWVVPTMLN